MAILMFVNTTPATLFHTFHNFSGNNLITLSNEVKIYNNNLNVMSLESINFATFWFHFINGFESGAIHVIQLLPHSRARNKRL